MSGKGQFFLFIMFIGILMLNLGISGNSRHEFDFSGIHNKQGNDSIRMVNQLIGKWSWDSTICFSTPAKYYAGFYYQLVFYNNAEMEVYKNNKLVQKSSWKLIRKKDGYKLETKPNVENTDGIVFVSNNQVKFRQNEFAKNEYFFSKLF